MAEVTLKHAIEESGRLEEALRLFGQRDWRLEAAPSKATGAPATMTACATVTDILQDYEVMVRHLVQKAIRRRLMDLGTSIVDLAKGGAENDK